MKTQFKKTLLALIAFLGLTIIPAKADYNGSWITMSIEKIDGQILKGYVWVASAYLKLDSINSTEYLKRALDQSGKEWPKRDSLTYFKIRLKYEYTAVWDSAGEEKHSTYYLTRKTALPFKSIKKIRIEDRINGGYGVGISNELKESDTTWMKKPPIKKLSYGGYLCSYQIFIHIDSKKIGDIVKQLELKKKEYAEMEVNSENIEKGDAMDDEIYKLIKKLNGQKVVIIQECSC